LIQCFYRRLLESLNGDSETDQCKTAARPEAFHAAESTAYMDVTGQHLDLLARDVSLPAVLDEPSLHALFGEYAVSETECRPGGAFAIERLEPGTYTVFVGSIPAEDHDNLGLLRYATKVVVLQED